MKQEEKEEIKTEIPEASIDVSEVMTRSYWEGYHRGWHDAATMIFVLSFLVLLLRAITKGLNEGRA